MHHVPKTHTTMHAVTLSHTPAQPCTHITWLTSHPKPKVRKYFVVCLILDFFAKDCISPSPQRKQRSNLRRCKIKNQILFFTERLVWRPRRNFDPPHHILYSLHVPWHIAMLCSTWILPSSSLLYPRFTKKLIIWLPSFCPRSEDAPAESWKKLKAKKQNVRVPG